VRSVYVLVLSAIWFFFVFVHILHFFIDFAPQNANDGEVTCDVCKTFLHFTPRLISRTCQALISQLSVLSRGISDRIAAPIEKKAGGLFSLGSKAGTGSAAAGATDFLVYVQAGISDVVQYANRLGAKHRQLKQIIAEKDTELQSKQMKIIELTSQNSSLAFQSLITSGNEALAVSQHEALAASQQRAQSATQQMQQKHQDQADAVLMAGLANQLQQLQLAKQASDKALHARIADLNAAREKCDMARIASESQVTVLQRKLQDTDVLLQQAAARCVVLEDACLQYSKSSLSDDMSKKDAKLALLERELASAAEALASCRIFADSKSQTDAKNAQLERELASAVDELAALKNTSAAAVAAGEQQCRALQNQLSEIKSSLEAEVAGKADAEARAAAAVTARVQAEKTLAARNEDAARERKDAGDSILRLMAEVHAAGKWAKLKNDGDVAIAQLQQQLSASNSSHALAQSASAAAYAALEEKERELQRRLQNTLSELAAVTASKLDADAVIQQLQQQLIACDEAHAASESAAAAALAFNQSKYDALQQQLTDVEGLLSVESHGKADAETRFENALIAGDQVVAEFAAFKESSRRSALDAETKFNLLQQELLSSQDAVAAAHARIGEKDVELEALSIEIQKLLRLKADAEADATASLSARLQAEANVINAEGRIQQLNAAADVRSRAEADLDARLREMTRSKEAVETVVLQLQQQIIGLENARDATALNAAAAEAASAAALASRLEIEAVLQSELKDSQKALAAIQILQASTAAALSSSEEKVDAYQAKLQEAAAEMASLSEIAFVKAADSNAKISELQRELKISRDARDHLSAALTASEDTNAALQKQLKVIDELRRELNGSRDALAFSKAETAAAIASNEEKNISLQNCIKQIDELSELKTEHEAKIAAAAVARTQLEATVSARTQAAAKAKQDAEATLNWLKSVETECQRLTAAAECRSRADAELAARFTAISNAEGSADCLIVELQQHLASSQDAYQSAATAAVAALASIHSKHPADQRHGRDGEDLEAINLFLQDVQARHEKSELQCRALQNQLSEIKSLLEAEVAGKADAEARAAAAVTARVQSEAALEEAKSSILRLGSDFIAADKLAALKQDAEAKIVLLEREVSSLRDALSLAQSSLSAALASNAAAEQAMQARAAECEESMRKALSAEDRVSAAHAATASAREREAALQEQLKATKSALAAAEAAAASAAASSKENEVQLLSKQMQISVRCDTALQELDEIKSQFVSIQQKLAAAEKALALSQAGEAAATSSCAEKDVALKARQNEIEELLRMNAAAEGQFLASIRDVEQAKSISEHAEARVSSMSKALEQAKSAAAHAEVQMAAAVADKEMAEGKLAARTQAALKKQAALEATIESLTATISEQSNLRAQYKRDADVKIAVLHEELASAERKIAFFQEQLAKAGL
jgi:hypothetical protein